MRQPGVPNFCCDVQCFCFHSTVEQLANALIELEGCVVRGRGTGLQEALVTQNTLRLLRYQGSEWSAIAPVFSRESRRLSEIDITRSISSHLQIDSLFLGIYDTAGAAEYKYVQNGVLVERYVYSVEPSECTASSMLRELDPSTQGYEQIDTFLRELKIIPPLFWSPFESIGQPVKAQQDVDADWAQVEELLILDRQ